MKFKNTSLELHQEDLEDDPPKRKLYKLLLNSFLGKFSQKNMYNQVKIAKTKEQIQDIFEKFDISDFEVVKEDFCQILCQNEPGRADRKTNCILTSFVNAYSRIDMYKHIFLLRESGFRVHYTDVDSLVFSGPFNAKIPFSPGYSFGQFKDEFPKGAALKSFLALGKKNYSITFSVDGAASQVTKVRGLSLKSNFAQGQVNPTTMINFASSFQEGKTEKVQVPQVRKRKSKAGLKKCLQSVSYSNEVSYERVLCEKSATFQTYPYGYFVRLK